MALWAAVVLSALVFPSVQAKSALVVYPIADLFVSAEVTNAAVEALKSEIAALSGWTVQTVTSAAVFDPAAADELPAALQPHDVVVFVHFNALQLSTPQRQTLQLYIKSKRGFIGIGAACPANGSDWSWYESLVGCTCDVKGTLKRQQQASNGNLIVYDRVHPSSSIFPERLQVQDVWLDLVYSPRPNSHVLASVVDSSIQGSKTGWDHPVSWCKMFHSGRAWFTSLGMSKEIWGTGGPVPLRQHITAGVRWASGELDGDCNSTLDLYWEKQVVDSNVDQPMQMAVTPTGDVYFVERPGNLKLFKSAEMRTILIGKLNVSTDVEDGLLGIALDPSFTTTGWVYLYWSPKRVVQSRLSRFTIQNDKLLLDSEKVLFTVDTQRKECCHSGGGLKYDYVRNYLFAALGDNTSPYGDAESFAPLDERPGRAFFDSQRTAANTMDLRGKILRIIPRENGTYDVPADNLFVNSQITGRQEIYVMGVRNPFRFAIEPVNGIVYWAEVGPNSEPDPQRGPRGYDEVNMAPTAGNYGWPYCIGPNEAYRNWNFATKSSTRNFDCNNPTNYSPNLDKGGSHALPAAQPAMIYYGYEQSTLFPEFTLGITTKKTPGRCAMLGPFYRHDGRSAASGFSATTGVLPAYFNNTVFLMEWRREYILELKMDSKGQLLKINHLWDSFEWRGPIDMAISPDGWIYVAEYGTDFEGLIREPRITRLRYTTQPRVPSCDLEATPSSGQAPLSVALSAAASTDPGNLKLTYMFSVPGAQEQFPTTYAPSPNVTATYTTNGLYFARVTVRNDMGAEASCTAPTIVGNTAPTVNFTFPPAGAVFSWGDVIPYDILVTDAEDGSTATGTISCAQVSMQPQLGHDNHYHSLVSQTGCSGSISALIMGHDGEVDLFYALEARYTDKGPGNLPQIDGKQLIVLQPQLKQAEAYTSSNLDQDESKPTKDPGGGFEDVIVRNGTWLCYNRYNLYNIESINVRVTVEAASKLVVRLDGANTGPQVASIDLPVTAQDVYQTFSAPVAGPNPIRQDGSLLCFLFSSTSSGDAVLFNWFSLAGPGARVRPPGAPVVVPAPRGGGITPPGRQNPPKSSAAPCFGVEAYFLVIAGFALTSFLLGSGGFVDMAFLI